MRNKRIIIYWIMLWGWMGFIFFMSNQPGDVSTRQSDLVVRIFVKLGIDLESSLGDIATLIVRKAAHFSEYFILGILTMKLVNYYFEAKLNKVYPLLFIFCYAFLDEIHQYFIPGRSMAFKDIMIDTFGGMTAILVYNIIVSFRKTNVKEITNS